MQQAALTIVVPIERELGPLLELLACIQQQVRDRKLRTRDGALIPFAELATIHFARFVVLGLPEPAPALRGRPAAPLLVFATDHDGPRASHVNELVTVAGAGLLRVFAACDKSLEGAPQDALREYFERHRVKRAASWGSHLGRSVDQIRREAFLRSEIRSRLGSSSGRLSRDPFEEAVAFVREREDLRWALEPPGPTTFPWHQKLLRGVIAALGAITLIPASPVWVTWLRIRELLDARAARERRGKLGPDWRSAERSNKQALFEEEDPHAQNQMTAVSEVKPGLLRLITLRVVLWIVDSLGRTLWDKGALRGIRTIHFARWFVVKEKNGTRWLVFLSNYDGSWENYLGEFVDQAKSGLTAVWSNTVGFPESKWLLGAGARRELKFKRWVRRQQIRTQVWYSAYPDLSVANVQNDSDLRRGLQGLRGLEERRAWLRRV
jgi:hypothetical protein